MEPKAKRSKLNDGVFVLTKLKGRIVFRIEGISKFLKPTRECHSEPAHIRGFDWTLCVRPLSDGPNNGLKFYIFCNVGYRGPDWNCAVSVILRCASGDEVVKMGRLDDRKIDATSSNSAWICTVII